MAPPRVFLRASREVRQQLFRKLDDHGRLSLFPSRLCPWYLRVGGLDVFKDWNKHRFICDARPPNLREQKLCHWTLYMASIAVWIRLYLPLGTVLWLFGDDLRDFYHCFKVSRKRALYTCFQGDVSPDDVRGCRAYRSGFDSEDKLCGGLDTLGQGGVNSVEFGMVTHLAVAVRSGGVDSSCLVYLHHRPPRGRYASGLILDDLVAGEIRDALVVPRLPGTEGLGLYSHPGRAPRFFGGTSQARTH